MFLAPVYAYRCPFIIFIWLANWESACNLRVSLHNKGNSRRGTEREENTRFCI